MHTADDYRRIMSTDGASIKGNTRTFNANRYRSVESLEGYDELKDQARAIKADAIDQLPALIESVRESVSANGGTVHLADDAHAATSVVRDVVSSAGNGPVVKSKSMTTEEIDLNEALSRDGVDVVETDLGEWVVQLAEDSPSHIVAPAIHFSRAEIASLVNDRFDPAVPIESATELTRFARDHLAEEIRAADVGVTGANLIAADTGTILLVTSEGNARRVVEGTRVHVAVAGIEKLVPSIESFESFIHLLARSATGQDLTSYLSLLTPPVTSPIVDFDDEVTPLSECDDAREFHLVLVDNGRMAMRADEDLRETLYCIRCGACANSCANFQSVGGHAFGGKTYSGGIATGWEAGVEGLDIAAGFNDLCTGCSRCVNACPVGIDIPWINMVVRDRVNRRRIEDVEWLPAGLRSELGDAGVPLQKRLFGHFATLASVGSALAPFSNWITDWTAARWALYHGLGLDPRREFPNFRSPTFVQQAANLEVDLSGADRSVVVYPDVSTNYLLPERGIATVRTLHALGIDVRISSMPPSGRAPLSQGMITAAADRAEAVIEAVNPHLDAGRDVIVIEPSDLALFRREYQRLVDPLAAERLAARVLDPFEFIHQLLDVDGRLVDRLRDGDGAAVAYHPHCQQRTVGAGAPTVAVLERLGFDVATSTVECCGMAGSFGYKARFYEVSMDVGDALRQEFETAEHSDRQVLASGASCHEQLGALLDRTARHPIEVVVPP